MTASGAGPLPRTTALPPRSRLPRGWWLPLAVIATLIAAGEVITRAGLIQAAVLPPPSTIAVTLGETLADPGTAAAVGQTLLAGGLGFALAAAAGIPLGLLLGFLPWVRASTRAVIEFLRPVPPLALLPLAVLLLGTGISVKIALVTFGAFFPVLIAAIAGALEADPVTRETGRVYGLSRAQRVRWILLPGAVPSLATGIRLGAIIALTVSIATELVVGSAGLGYLINQARFAGLVPRMYALILITGVIGYLISTGLRALEKRLLGWHSSNRQEAA